MTRCVLLQYGCHLPRYASSYFVSEWFEAEKPLVCNHNQSVCVSVMYLGECAKIMYWILFANSFIYSLILDISLQPELNWMLEVLFPHSFPIYKNLPLILDICATNYMSCVWEIHLCNHLPISYLKDTWYLYTTTKHVYRLHRPWTSCYTGGFYMQ